VKPRPFDFLVVVFVIIVCLAGSWWFWTIHRVVKPWERVAREDTEEHVIALLGKPQFVSDGSEMMKETYDGKDGFTTAGCQITKGFRYQTFLFGPYFVGFDSNRRVVVKGHNTLCCSQ
jgi:hypothetical protein